jgi:hypothetical protein
VYFNNAKVLTSVKQADNGVVYVVDRMLDVPEGTILQILSNPKYNATEFLSVLKAARYDTIMNRTTGSYT